MYGLPTIRPSEFVNAAPFSASYMDKDTHSMRVRPDPIGQFAFRVEQTLHTCRYLFDRDKGVTSVTAAELGGHLRCLLNRCSRKSRKPGG